MDTKGKIEYWLQIAHYGLYKRTKKFYLHMDKKVVEIARVYAQKVKNLMPVSMVILYGSHAQGTAQQHSDIDIAVVVDKFHGDYLQASAVLFSLVRTVNKRIEPVLVCREHDKSGFFENVLRHGKIIYRKQ